MAKFNVHGSVAWIILAHGFRVVQRPGKSIIKGKDGMLGDYDFEILLKHKTLKECGSFIKDYVEEMYLVPGGYKVKKDITLLGTTSPVGFLGGDIIFQYTKPCFGFFVLKLPDEAEEIRRLREQYKMDRNVKKIK
ncbi:MAG: hypothetical protein QG646_4676 [Euryarchaeota archaeon]|nr:hypothetical protein [Euryarchaeota archaeon]